VNNAVNSLETTFYSRKRGGYGHMIVGFYNYLCNRCLSQLMLWIQIPLKARCTWF